MSPSPEYVVPGRLELPTSTLSVWRSNQLSYRTLFFFESACPDPFGAARLSTPGWLCPRPGPYAAARLPSFSLLYLKKTGRFRTRGKDRDLRLYITEGFYFCISLPGYRHASALLLSVLSRKEVFQPHLPVRLPCYDLAPITSFALGRPSRSRTSGAPGFHGLTGGVYKGRERIHRAMADARLLANPASCGRVADPSPN